MQGLVPETGGQAGLQAAGSWGVLQGPAPARPSSRSHWAPASPDLAKPAEWARLQAEPLNGCPSRCLWGEGVLVATLMPGLVPSQTLGPCRHLSLYLY